MTTPQFLSQVLNGKIQPWLQNQSPAWSIALGIGLGLGIGAGAVFGVGGLLGVGLCALVLGTAVWVAKDAEPVLIGLESSADSEPSPEPELPELLDMVELKGGTFLMGSPDSDKEASASEKPQHEVSVSDFSMSRFPITRQLHAEIVGKSPAQWEDDSRDQQLPANSVTWFEAIAFCNALSERSGLLSCYRMTGKKGEDVKWDTSADGYRLPTEAEWEYACRAGTTSKWFCGDDPAELDSYAWFAENSDEKVHLVGKKAPNPRGLHDMHGNVWEWCWDWYGDYAGEMQRDPIGDEKGQYRVLRGGSA